MTGDDWVRIAWFVMAIILVFSAVVAHRIPGGTMLKWWLFGL